VRHRAGGRRLPGAGSEFSHAVLDGIPLLSPDNYDQARRFIVLIDTLYEHRTKLIASADAMPEQLHLRGENAGARRRQPGSLQPVDALAGDPAGRRIAAVRPADDPAALLTPEV